MRTKRANQNIHIRIKHSATEEVLSQSEVKARLTDFFALLFEIDQQNNVTKEYADAK